MTTGVNTENLPVVVGVKIPLDESGRYNLNTIHKASGEGDDKSPGQWLRRKTTKELIKELDANLLKNRQDVNLHSAQKSINVVNGGINPGTFAHELLAVSYAGWIRPDFQLDVNQAFIDFRAGKQAPVNTSLPNFDDPIAAAEAWIEAKKAERLAIGYVDRQARYINKLESHLADGITPVQFCKQLNGVNIRMVNAFLEERNWLFDDRPKSKNPRWRVKAYARDQYLTEHAGQVEQEDGEMRDIYKPLLKRKGAAWLYRHYLNGELPMKKTWNGEYTHDTDLAKLLEEKK
ncbi:KilA-N domain-containing protein [Salmonella enterica]|uniref:KilA-N domain-containing protein n=1 Tax=Salmonella enterica TaxID=28901 RepID=A0A749KY12_SALER|nr:KilA-N domain-containing protein [Salmonella enterica]EEI4534493.1 KilA-N domain-containing protein [Salmonella enterica]EJP3911760.1 KilA-N domain-containing protein [Salmonella enterica]HAF5756249.1 KilA-N domain-containing protein [Salmonella enterica]